MKKTYKKQAIIEDIMKQSSENTDLFSREQKNDSGIKYHGIDAVCKHLIETEKEIYSLHEMKNLIAYQNALEGNRLKVFVKRAIRKLTFWFINPIVCSHKYLIEKTIKFFSNVNTLLCMYKDNLFKQAELIDQLMQQADEQARQIADLKEQMAQLSQNNKVNQSYIDLIKDNEATVQRIVYDHNEEGLVDYFDFENKFRGSEEDIKTRVNRYSSYFDHDGVIMDIGCGRGELLEVLIETDRNCIGIDIYEPFVQYCQSKGLPVEKIDAIQKLNTFEDCALSGITSIQVIEHLSNRYLVDMIALCAKKLKKGGIIILETQNVETLYVLARHFYVDMEHKKPVHPKALEYLLNSNGFEIIKVDYPEYSVIKSLFIPHVNNNENNINEKIDIANELLYGPTDYAIIARKI